MPLEHKFAIIVAFDRNFGIGKANKLPWHLPGDLKQFRKVTTESEAGKQNAVIMGRKTWESISEKRRPLPDRINVVLTKQLNYQTPPQVMTFTSLESALDLLSKVPTIDKCFVIGGAEIYRLALENPNCELIYATEINQVFDCDAFIEPILDLVLHTALDPSINPFAHVLASSIESDISRFEAISQSETLEENGIQYRYKVFKRTNSD